MTKAAVAVEQYPSEEPKLMVVLDAELHPTVSDEQAGVTEEFVDDFADEPDQLAPEPDEIKESTADLDKPATNPDSVRMYLDRIGKTALLTAVEEVDLAKRIEAGLYAGTLDRLVRASTDERSELLANLKTPGSAGGNTTPPKVPLEETVRELAAKVESIESLPTQRRNLLLRNLGLIEKDGEHAKDHLLRANLRLVVSVAKRYTGHGMEFLDLVEEGNVGLIRAVEKFDYAKGFKFSTYATWWIRQNITRAMADQGRTIRLPVHLVEQVVKVQHIRRELMRDYNRLPTNAELAKELDITEERVRELIVLNKGIISLEQPIGDEGDSTLGDFIADKTTETTETQALRNLTSNGLSAQLPKILGTLLPREERVMRMRYGLNGAEPMTLDQIGAIMGCSREWIRLVERAAMKKLRQPARAQMLRGYLED